MFCNPWISPATLPLLTSFSLSLSLSLLVLFCVKLYLVAEALLPWAQSIQSPVLVEIYSPSSIQKLYALISVAPVPFSIYILPFVSKKPDNQFNRFTSQFSAILTSVYRWGSSPQVSEWWTCSWIVTSGTQVPCVAVELSESLSLSPVLIYLIIPGRWVIAIGTFEMSGNAHN